ncbi:MAG: hypothetical protein QG574_5027 [Cyanobacteriota bacterium erpe_2018_sw_21hr_WHONDRS-SW48-000092_B_bin.40]|nr:hypothetical protein [Cyanobacteriota bacterium erpe_2018_sw_21hr_WHONDRS-SW48-000092_B_bin.40]
MDLRLGTILSHFGLLQEHEFDRALKVANETRLPVGKVLVMFEQITDNTLKAVIDAQWMLKDGLISIGQAQHAVDLVRRKNWAFNDALVTMGIDAYATRGARLGELMVGSGQLSEDEITKFLKVSNYSGLPLGRILLLLDRVSENALGSTLRLQHDIRVGGLEVDTGLALIRESVKREPITRTDNLLLGELLSHAGILKDSEVAVALDIAAANSKMVGEVLTEHGWISDTVLDKALSLQKRARSKEISLDDAISTLKGQAETGAFAPLSAFDFTGPTNFERNISLYEYLRLTGYITPEKLSDVVTRAAREPAIIADLQESPQASLKETLKVAVTDSNRFLRLLSSVLPDDKDIIDTGYAFQQQVRKGTIKLDRSILEFTLMRTKKDMAFSL